jgi:hypothetical protein
MAEPYSFMNTPKVKSSYDANRAARQNQRTASPPALTMNKPTQQQSWAAQMNRGSQSGGVNSTTIGNPRQTQYADPARAHASGTNGVVSNYNQPQQGNTMQANNGGYGSLPTYSTMGGPTQPGGPGGAITPGQTGNFNPMPGGFNPSSNMGSGPVSRGQAGQMPNQPGGWTPPQLPGWQPQPQQGGNSPTNDIFGDFFKSDPNLFNPSAYKDNDAMTPNYLSQIKDLVQMQQNAKQWGVESGEALTQGDFNRWLAGDEHGFQKSLSTQQQQMAEWMARTGADQWDKTHDWTKTTDTWTRDLTDKGLNNDFTMGMDRNASERYGADKQLEGAGLYSGAQKYQADQGRIADMYGSDNQLRGNMYGADRSLQGYQYQADRGLDEAGLYSGAQRYGTDAQERMNAEMMKNNLAVANTQVYGRSMAPNLRWAKSWA